MNTPPPRHYRYTGFIAVNGPDYGAIDPPILIA